MYIANNVVHVGMVRKITLDSVNDNNLTASKYSMAPNAPIKLIVTNLTN